MRKISVLIILLFIVFWQSIKQEEKEALSPTQSDEIFEHGHINERTVKRIEARNTLHKKVISSEGKVTTTYNEDPFIDMLLIYSKFKYCFDLMSVPSTNSAVLISNDYNTSSQEKKNIRINEYLNICEKIAKQHPEYSFEKGFNFMDVKQSTSVLGKRLMDGFYNKNDGYELNEKIADIKGAGADLFLSSNYVFFMDYREIFQWGLYDLLQSNNRDYVMAIYNYAQDLYACRQGAECGKYSTVVLAKCIINDAFCVDDFETIVNTQLTIGQQADIALAYDYLFGIFGE